MTAPILYSVTRAERSEQVAAMRAKGLTYKQIAGALGISTSYVHDLIVDPDGSKLAARVKRYEGVCKDCGEPTRNGHNTNAPERCDPCTRKRRAAKHGTLSKYHAGCGCDACRAANREHARSRKGKTTPTHSASGYMNYGCRCDVCREAVRVYNRKTDHARYTRAAKARVRAGAEVPTHGLTGYTYYGCRCEECRETANAYQRRRYHERKAGA